MDEDVDAQMAIWIDIQERKRGRRRKAKGNSYPSWITYSRGPTCNTQDPIAIDNVTSNQNTTQGGEETHIMQVGKRKRSEVWNHMVKTKKNGMDIVICTTV